MIMVLRRSTCNFWLYILECGSHYLQSLDRATKAVGRNNTLSQMPHIRRSINTHCNTSVLVLGRSWLWLWLKTFAELFLAAFSMQRLQRVLSPPR
jgi:hypothetical protein